MKASARVLRRLCFHYPFTPAGTVLLAASLLLVGRGLAQANPYALFLALLALLVLALLALAGGLQARACARQDFLWDCSAPLVSRWAGTEQRLHGAPVRLLPFFRVHFRLRGRLSVGRGAALRVGRQLSFAGPGPHLLPLAMPLCGRLSAVGRFTVRDLFGLTRARFGEEAVRSLTVLPARLSPEAAPVAEPTGGFEERSVRRSAEEEKYFMREYQPGDRFRDINWKVSSRLQELITRISPVTQEKTRQLAVDFRHFRPEGQESLESVLHLDYLKSWLLAFLRSLKRSDERLQFRVRTGAENQVLAGEEDIERFAAELAELFYQTDPGPAEPPESELFVFSTPFDRGLPHFLAAHPRTRAHVFRTARGGGRNPQVRPLFPPGGALAEAFLPGPWVWRREPARATALGPVAVLEEVSLAVRVLP